MAIDTADKRASISELDIYITFPEPDGDISSLEDLRHLLGLYRGLAVQQMAQAFTGDAFNLKTDVNEFTLISKRN